MQRRKALDLLIELGRRARDDAAAGVARAVRHERKERDLKDTLLRYQDDYRQSTPKRPGSATGPLQIERHRHFVDRLDAAVEDQQARERRAGESRAQSEQALALTERRIRILERLQARQRDAQRRREDQVQQRITDEQAALLARRSRSR